MTIPPNVLAALGIAFGAWLAARTGQRASLIIASAFVAIIGTTPSSKVAVVRFTPILLAGYIVLLTTTTRTLSS
jgi:hypothetical protein